MSDLLENWLNQGQTVIENGLLEHYRSLGLNSEELIFVIQLQSYLGQKLYFPSMAEIAERMGIKEAEVFAILHQLIQKKIIIIETEKDAAGKDADRYSLMPMYKKLALLLDKKHASNDTQAQEVDLLAMFQQEFGRLLTPIEMQTIGEWLDKDRYPKELIVEALREAVLNQKYSLRYMDRILMAWEKKNIRTTSQVKQETKRFSQYQGRQTKEEPEVTTEHVPLFNWLDSSD